ncbi:unnamed protein product [Moneuplotes crassus]|uniref:Uncharacterized protein n=1 Tax=Euplotes crassus TaxID=5936 RepID=A0AAD1U4F9_EUPCR|nr:unnamed protein product [Moneuplotes crassus]
MVSLCSCTRQLWSNERKAFAVGLNKKSGCRTLMSLKTFNSTFVDYFESISDFKEFHLYDYVLLLKTEESIREFCEFIRNFKLRTYLQLKKVVVHYKEGMEFDLLNSPYDVLKECSMDTSCIQINGLWEIMPKSPEDIVKYTRRFWMNIITHNPLVNQEEYIQYDCVKEVFQLNFESEHFSFIIDPDTCDKVVPLSIRQTCREISIESYPAEEIDNEHTIRDLASKLTKMFPHFRSLRVGFMMNVEKITLSKYFKNISQNGVTLSSPFSLDDPNYIVTDCNIFYYDEKTEEYQSFSASKLIYKSLKEDETYPKLPKGFIMVRVDSICEVHNISSKNTHDLSKFKTFISSFFANKKSRQSSSPKNYPKGYFFFQKKDFHFIGSLRTLLYCCPPACENLFLAHPSVKDSEKVLSALEKTKITNFKLTVRYHKNIHLFLTKLLKYKVTDLVLCISEDDLSKVPLKFKTQVKEQILSSKSIQTLTVQTKSKSEKVKRAARRFEHILDKVFAKEMKLKLRETLIFDEVFVY